MNQLQRTLLFLFLLLLSQFGFSQKRIAIIGSSSAAGYFPQSSGYPKDSAWAFKVKKHYKDLGIIDTIFNLAQSSTDCFEGMPSSYVPPAGFNYRLPNPNINITKAVNLIPKPDVIIVNYPTNNYDWIPNEQILTCLQIIKDSANAKNIVCYITTTQPRDGFSPTERQKLKTLRDLILNQFGVWAIDFFTDIVQEPSLKIKEQYSIGDGVHLNPEGHSVLKNKVLDKNIFFVLVPVKFTELEAIPQANKIVLKWKTLSENFNQHFVIETSNDGIHFLSLDSIPGLFNSTLSRLYSFVVNQPTEGQNFFRIVAVSSLGQKEYSNIVSVKYQEKLQGSVAINYANNLINLSFKEAPKKPVLVRIFNIQGKVLLNHRIGTLNLLFHSINFSNYPAGKYVIQVIFEDHTETNQFIKL